MFLGAPQDYQSMEEFEDSKSSYLSHIDISKIYCITRPLHCSCFNVIFTQKVKWIPLPGTVEIPSSVWPVLSVLTNCQGPFHMTANGERLQDRWKAATLERPVISVGRAQLFLKVEEHFNFIDATTRSGLLFFLFLLFCITRFLLYTADTIW